ncbi:MAG: hypothetical protein HZA58_01385, partial [Acidimicrobiia bacterium]|nr:hypothetical protein [Acidimicrobiia bacterium]
AAVETLYAKVSSPVLTGVALEVEGVTVSDIHPDPLPDIFRGGQLVVAGRYEGSGDATITLSGRVRGEPVALVFDDIRFAAAGGDPTVARLWATRKIGELLTAIRLEGPNDEIIGQIVRLSIRWGIVTPYTSYLVTEDAPFGDEAIDEIARAAADTAAATTLPISGEAAVGAADFAGDLAAADTGAVPGAEYGDLVRTGGGRTFRYSEGRWVDTAFEPGSATVRVAFGSPDYFALAASDPLLAAALAVGTEVTVLHQGTVFEIVADGGPSDPLPDPTTTTLPLTATDSDTDTTLAALPGGASGGGAAEFPMALAVLAAALIAAVTLALRTRRR